MKTYSGIVVSTKMTLTATVVVETKWQHPAYKKIVKSNKKYLVDNSLKAKEGDQVEITETKPISKHKKFRITKIIK